MGTGNQLARTDLKWDVCARWRVSVVLQKRSKQESPQDPQLVLKIKGPSGETGEGRARSESSSSPWEMAGCFGKWNDRRLEIAWISSQRASSMWAAACLLGGSTCWHNAMLWMAAPAAYTWLRSQCCMPGTVLGTGGSVQQGTVPSFELPMIQWGDRAVSRKPHYSVVKTEHLGDEPPLGSGRVPRRRLRLSR